MNSIWIVDDDVVLGRLLVGRLNAFGFEAKVFSDPDEILSALAGGVSPRIILTELVWPNYSPQEWVAMMVQKLPDTQVIAVTMIDDPEILNQVFDAGVGDYLVKPFDFQTLIEKVQLIVRTNVYGNLSTR